MSTPGFISLPPIKSESFIRANTLGVFQVEILVVPNSVPIPSVSCGLFDADNQRKYHFADSRNVTAVRAGQTTRLLFSTTVKDQVAPGFYSLIAEWKGGSHTVPVLVPSKQEISTPDTLPDTPVATLPGVPVEETAQPASRRRRR